MQLSFFMSKNARFRGSDVIRSTVKVSVESSSLLLHGFET